MIKKISLLLGLTNVLSSTLNLTRTANYEQIICYKNLNCTKFLSTQLAPSLCECSDGTFFYRKNSQNPLECIKGTGDVASKYKMKALYIIQWIYFLLLLYISSHPEVLNIKVFH